jgi:hypothetical protein
MIAIKPSHRGRLHAATGTKKGAKVPLAKEKALKAHGTPAQKKMAIFALNSRGWAHSNPPRKKS